MSKIEATQISTHGRNREDMRRDAKSLLNRLRSIQADASFVSEISNLFPQFPVIANERCGTWYVHPSKIHKPGVYFKSTDGHTGIWDFNLRRYNPHLISTIIRHGGCIIVDSTRKGKRVPDALSKTIPIWCATINNAVRKCALQNQAAHEDSGEAVAGGHTLKKEQDESSTAKTAAEQTITTKDESGAEAGEAAALLIPALNGDSWDTRYHSLPSLISRSEHVQIADKIEGFAEKLMRFTDMTPLTTKLLKPIRPIWLTPQSFLLRHDLPDYSQCAFLPVICLSASRVVQDGMEERDGYLYVQGSGDDEEMWSKGLKPELFWENEEYLLEEGISPAECEQRAVEVVKEAKRKLMEKSRHRRVHFTPSMELCSEIKPSSIWIGNNASGRIPDCWDAGFDMVINCGAEIKRHPLCEFSNSDGGKDYYYLHLPIAEGKKGQHQLLEMIPIAIKAVHLMFATNNKDSKVIQETRSPRILVHCQQGMDRSVGVSLALLVSCFDETTGAYSSGGGGGGESFVKATASKEMIQRRLFQIMSHRLAARPSRATLKMVNTFFMSPTDPPPAKYKS
ncbi:tRNA A64-2'-O-ribosylphosphate transferase [Linnemannia elongata]|nr:tRNA A64-2'-O-ribosylphosphate transferase [Linnemannia elongata]